MAGKQELEISIDEDGNVSIKVVGCSGPSCVELTRGIEEALGEVVDRQRTSDYYQQPNRSEGTVGGGTGQA